MGVESLARGECASLARQQWDSYERIVDTFPRVGARSIEVFSSLWTRQPDLTWEYRVREGRTLSGKLPTHQGGYLSYGPPPAGIKKCKRARAPVWL
jgi:hypothetical protein